MEPPSAPPSAPWPAWPYDGIIKAIDEGLADDVFTRIPLTMTVDKGWLDRQQPGVDVDHVQAVREHGAHYEIKYDWHVVD